MVKKFRNVMALCLAAMLLLTCFAGCKEAEEANQPGVIQFSKLGDALSGTMQVTKEGAILDSSSRTPRITVALAETIGLSEKGIFTLMLKNTSDAEKLTVQFVTSEDDKYTNFKIFDFPLEKTEGFQKLTVDVSGQYGWLGHLAGVRITAVGLNSGEVVLKSMSLEEGGKNYIQGLKVEDPFIYLTARDRVNVKRINMGPDGIVGSWRDDQGNIHYIGSSSAGGVSGAFVTTGTPDDPFKTVRYAGKRVNGVDWTELGYCSIAQVIKEPTTGMLIGVTHLEHHNPGGLFVGTIGLSTSTDNGETWNFLGEFISHDLPVDERPDVNRDIGNGTILMDDEYLYLFIIDMAESDLAGGMAVCRVKLTELYEKVLAGELPEAFKYKDGQWNEPGWGGAFSNVLPEGVAPNFLYLSYNTVLQKYIMLICTAPYYQANSGDILMLVSDSFLDWSNAQRQWIATGCLGEQYPSIFSDAQDCQTESGETFYLYWCAWDDSQDWKLMWASAQYMCCKVTVSG